MKIASTLSCILFVFILFSACFKDAPEEPIYFPWESNIEASRNGKMAQIRGAQFAFDDRVRIPGNPEGDSLLNIVFSNFQNDPHYESIYLKLKRSHKDSSFVTSYKLNDLMQIKLGLNLYFGEYDTIIGYFQLDTSYNNILAITQVSENKKLIKGHFDFRVVLPEKDQNLPGQWAPDTITYSNGKFWIKSLE